MSKTNAILAGAQSSQNVSINSIARIGGFAYLGVIIFALFAEAYVRGSIVDFSDLSKMSKDIVAQAGLWRLGMVSDVFTIACDLIVAATFYVLLKPAAPTISISAAFIRISAVTVLAVGSIFHFVPLLLLSNPTQYVAFSSEQLAQLSALSIKIHNEAYHVSLILFGLNCILLGIGFFKSKLIPNWISIMLGVCGFAYFFNSVAHYIAPKLLGDLSTFILLYCLIAEGSLTLWLIFKGVKE